jgi:hypothetical protein
MFDISGKKIILHNLTFCGIENVPGILDFDQRGVVYANPGDCVITKSPVDPNYLRYLETLGWDFRNCTFLNPLVMSDYKYNSVFYDQEIINAATKLDGYYLDTYHVTNEEADFAKRINKPFYGNCAIAEKFGTKTGFSTLAEQLQLRVAPGIARIRDVVELEKYIDEFLQHIDAKELVIKIDEGISGAGSTKFSVSDYKKFTDLERKAFLNFATTRVPQTLANSGFVVEAWIENVISSPSIQLEFFPSGEWRMLSIHDQVLEKAEQWYVGCIYPPRSIPPKLVENIFSDIEKIVDFLLRQRFIGFLGLDLIITESDDYYWVEANMRKPGTFYPRTIAAKLNGGSLENVFYRAADFTVDAFRGFDINKLQEIFKNYLYDAKTKTGVVFYNLGALAQIGRFALICLGQSMHEVDKIYAKIIAV